MEVAFAVETMVLPVDTQTSKKIKLMLQILIIRDVLIPNPFSLKTVSNFNSKPPFGLYDITDYDKQELAAYKSFNDCIAY